MHFRPALFEPTFHKHAGTPCGGCQIHVTNRQTFRPVDTGLALIEAFRIAGPTHFAWREPPYEYEFTRPPIDILAGSARLREGLEQGRAASSLARDWNHELEPFLLVREQFLRYA